MLALLLALALPSAPPDAHRHHGFFLHADLGLGYFRSSASGAAITGLGAGLDLSVGFGISERVAIYAAIFDAVTAAPRLSVDGVQSAPRDWSAGTGGLGAGLSYYFMPANLYLTAAAGAGALTVTQGSTSYSTKIGFVGRFGLGKEWFVSDSWSLGGALLLVFGTHTDQGDAPQRWTTVAPLLAFSATFY